MEFGMMRKTIYLFFFPLVLFGSNIDLGVDVFFKEGFDSKLQGKKIGLITNQTGVDSSQTLTKSLFVESKKINLIALFAPEHGIDGKIHAGKAVSDEKQNQIPIYSLHGKTRRPTDEMLKGIDILLFDVQDIGIRPYTYSSTLFYVMEEAKKKNIQIIVLDRPNPMGGEIVDGPMLDEKFRSFIGYINVPYCHGMTIGELACYFNEKYKIGCNLEVIKMKGWKRDMSFRDTGLVWIPTSPNIPEADTPFYCATTGLIGELDLVNIGIGYTLPFKIVGAPWIDAELFSKTLNDQKIPGVQFTPIHYKPFYGSCKEKECHGVKIHITSHRNFHPLLTQSFIIGILKTLYPNEVIERLKAQPKEKMALFNKAYGSDAAFNHLLNEKFATWKLIEHQKEEREDFIKERAKYLLY
jgi:uncharacterized protein YbbC (DUF1343 family)